MTHFADEFLKKVEEKKSPLCVGLDPHFEMIPDSIIKGKSEVAAIEEFLIKIIDATAPFAPVVKPNLAFFEVWGADGWRTMEKVCEHAKKKNLLVVADGKRNDIGSTAEKYARAFLSKNTPYDALTITPYLGQDGIIPFAKVAAENGKGIFVLVKTSNPSAGEFQDLPIGDCLVHEEVARAVARIGSEYIGESGFSNVGAVVGATQADDIRILRSEMPGQLFLMPGYGAQGAGAQDVAEAFYKGGTGAMINSSRGILFSGGEKDFTEGAAKAAQKAQEELWEAATKK